MSARRGWLSFLLFLASVPMGLTGFVFYTGAQDSRGSTPLSGLSVVGAAVGIALMVLALFALVLGARGFIGAGRASRSVGG